MSTDRPDILIVSTADWDNPYWTNKQHVAVGLAARGHRVFYIESQGLRAPTATAKDLRRIWRRLKRGLRPPREVRPGLWVWSPLVVPLQKYAAIRSLNRALLAFGVGFWTRLKGLRPRLLWTYSPLTTGLYNTARFDLVVYHAVDDISAQPGMPVDTIRAGEADLLQKADLVFVTAPNLRDMHIRANPETHYFPNVADFPHFNQALNPDTPVPADIAAIPGPRIGFVGAISSYKLDFDMIAAAAAMRPDWSFVFVGEIGEGDPLTDASTITAVANIHFLGGRPYASLPGYLKAMDVAILPNRLNDYTRSMFPMKFFEYLAAGRPVVSARLHALQDYGHVAAFADSADDFVTAIAAALAGEGADLAARFDAARDQTYERRTERMMALVEARSAQKAAQQRQA